MTLKSKNILSLSLSLMMACMVFIPSGCRNGWPLWLHFVSIIVFVAGFCISWWGTDYAFRSIPLDKMTGKDKALQCSSFFMLIIGFDLIIGLFGYSWWLVLTGCAVVLAYSFVQRRLADKYGKKITKDEQ